MRHRPRISGSRGKAGNRVSAGNGASGRSDVSAETLRISLEPVVRGLGMVLVELTLSRHRGSVRVRAVVCGRRTMGVEDCSRVHRALLPRLELAFPGEDLYVEVSSPGIDRLIKGQAEFACYIGRGIRCYRTDISGWSAGILESAEAEHIVLRGKTEVMRLTYDVIAKARLDHTQEDEGHGN